MNQYATYCPEDNKLRLYVGRVPREEYMKLRAEGWTALHKQREAGGGDFAAVWTPERRDTAIAYSGGVIEDEDMSPADRAADRAERFSGYRDKRTDEAGSRADAYDAGPQAHGYQSEARAERAAARHDRIADRACDAWSNAEYWQRRTAGVISHALHKAAPGVRMGRIITLEAELRRMESRTDQRGLDWANHYRLRLAYENQMIEAEGGRLATAEMVCGGFLYGKQIYKVNKSPATGRITSVAVKVARVSSWTYRVANELGTDYALMQMDTERLPPDAYREPTADELAAYEATRKAEKAAAKAKKAPALPLINPTDEDAERLQAMWNEWAMTERVESYKRTGYSLPVTDCPPQTVARMTQAQYSAISKGSYARASTREVFPGGALLSGSYNGRETCRAKYGREVCAVRQTWGDHYSARRLIVLTDKPQKALPVAVWQQVAQAVGATA